jgi:excisionase family DNA binding protein
MDKQEKLQNLLKAEEVSRVLNIPVGTVYLYARKGIIPSIVIGEKVRFAESDIATLTKKARKA